MRRIVPQHTLCSFRSRIWDESPLQPIQIRPGGGGNDEGHGGALVESFGGH